MTRILMTSAAALVLAVAAASSAFAQTGGTGPGASGVSIRSTGSGVSFRSGTSGRAGTTTPPVQAVPNPAVVPNNQVPSNAIALPGGGSQIPQTPGSAIGTAVPVYSTQNNSSLAGSINQSSQRSSSVDCTGVGTRSSTGSGSNSTTTLNCSTTGALGTQSIMGSGSAINVSSP